MITHLPSLSLMVGGTSSYYSALIGISGAQTDDDLRTEVASTVLIPFDATGLKKVFGDGVMKREENLQPTLEIGSVLKKLFEDGVVKREENLQPTLEVEIARHTYMGDWRREKRKNNAPTRPHVGLGHLQQSRSVVPFLTDNTRIELASKIKSERDGEIREVYEKAFRMENEVKLVDEISGELGHSLRFGYREFSLITGYRFGTVNFDLHPSSDLKFGNTVFPNKIGFIITNLDIIGVIEDEERFGKLYDDDAIRLCLLLAVEVIFMGRLLTFKVDDTLFRSVENLEALNSFPWDRNYVPTYTLSGFVFAFQESRAPPIKEQHSLFETYLAKLEKARKRGKTGFIVSSIGGTSDNSVKKKWLNDLVIMELNYRVFKLETIIQDYLREEELRLCLEDEEMLRCEHEKLIVEENRFRFDEAKRLRLEEENMLQLEEQKKNKRKEFMNSSHRQPGQVKCKFPWNDDYTVDRNFWLKLVCLVPTRKGWLTEELLLQKGLPLFYVNGERYTAPWSEVDQVFIPINETGEHWCLAQFHILSGEVTFYDTGYTYDYDYHDWSFRLS
ncbi:phospholipase-like protein [Tanacetum coccineum]